jgi:SAM-dependent MidA family methyltransferase
MGSSSVHPVSSAQRTALAARAAAEGFIGFDAFMDVALYHATEGYYRRESDRIGRHKEADFFTASSLGPVFGELVVASVGNLLGDHDPGRFTFVEIGAEQGRCILDNVSHPFAGLRPIRVGEEIELTGPCIVFSNELWDAQPCRRYVGTGSGWDELGVRLQDEGLVETRRPATVLPPELPSQGPEGYHVDHPGAATALAAQIASQPWHGLFLAFDYGRTWTELLHETPQGTVRAYHRHRQSSALLENMGSQDLTCHVCWDHLAGALTQAGFTPQSPLSQEAFLVKHAGEALARIMAAEAGQMSARKSGLLQLLHPSALGQKFQVLSAWRDEV